MTIVGFCLCFKGCSSGCVDTNDDWVLFAVGLILIYLGNRND